MQSAALKQAGERTREGPAPALLDKDDATQLHQCHERQRRCNSAPSAATPQKAKTMSHNSICCHEPRHEVLLQESMEAAIESAAQQTAQKLQAIIKQAGAPSAPPPPPSGKENDTQGVADASGNAQAGSMTPAMPASKTSRGQPGQLGLWHHNACHFLYQLLM